MDDWMRRTVGKKRWASKHVGSTGSTDNLRHALMRGDGSIGEFYLSLKVILLAC